MIHTHDAVGRDGSSSHVLRRIACNRWLELAYPVDPALPIVRDEPSNGLTNAHDVIRSVLNPAHLRAAMPTDVAVRTPVEQSLQQLETASVQRQQALTQSQQQDMDTRVRENMSMRMA
ncbi:hypothetical protein KWH03_15250 [Xanthomonas campestris pv. lawsoniae]|uniref:hypothetical protein n=1 Tax=Xanthomonas euvesicatoria TaxID=456327 RepID=UPI001C4673D2|nr:hypothetical protein [Xanthomonas euvesicatoria]MBV6803030.1 hypothetical protein [Xanthomonas campestris pv. lawsoniae]